MISARTEFCLGTGVYTKLVLCIVTYQPARLGDKILFGKDQEAKLFETGRLRWTSFVRRYRDPHVEIAPVVLFFF